MAMKVTYRLRYTASRVIDLPAQVPIFHQFSSECADGQDHLTFEVLMRTGKRTETPTPSNGQEKSAFSESIINHDKCAAIWKAL